MIIGLSHLGNNHHIISSPFDPIPFRDKYLPCNHFTIPKLWIKIWVLTRCTVIFSLMGESSKTYLVTMRIVFLGFPWSLLHLIMLIHLCFITWDQSHHMSLNSIRRWGKTHHKIRIDIYEWMFESISFVTSNYI